MKGKDVGADVLKQMINMEYLPRSNIKNARLPKRLFKNNFMFVCQECLLQYSERDLKIENSHPWPRTCVLNCVLF